MLGTLRGSVLAASRPKGIKGDVVGPTTFATSTESLATAFFNQRRVDRTQNGVLWVLYWDGTSGVSTPMQTRYSTDDGATWVDPGAASKFGFAGTFSNYTPDASFFIDLDDYAHVVYEDRHSGEVHYRRGTPNANRTAWTWSAAQSAYPFASAEVPDVIAHREGTGWKVHIVVGYYNGSTTQTEYVRYSVTSAGGLSKDVTTQISATISSSQLTYPSIDFNHTGDGKTVAGETPHLYVGWSAGATGAGKGIRFRKATYAAGAWTWGTEREIDSTRVVAGGHWLNCMFDGTRIVMPGFLNEGVNNDFVLYERDAADTVTTTRVLIDNVVANSDLLVHGSASYDKDGNVYSIGRFTDVADKLGYRKWTRSTATLGPIVTVGTLSRDSPRVSTKRGYSKNRIEFIYTNKNSSPHDVTFGGIK